MRSWVLGLETGGELLSAALVEAPPDSPAIVLEEVRVARGGKRADLTLTLVAELLARHAITPADLALIAAPRGPGGFTGIRVALSLAEGLSLATGVRVWPVSSLAALALNARGHGDNVLTLIDARRGEVYAAAYRLAASGPPETLLAPMLATCEAAVAAAHDAVPEMMESERTVALGSGALAHGLATPEISEAKHIGSAAAAAELAIMEWAAAGWDVSRAPAVDAAYLRKSEAEVAADLREARAARTG
jgi:tRNA threonylcarbamoyladenosine biosynthesis protein TsaB